MTEIIEIQLTEQEEAERVEAHNRFLAALAEFETKEEAKTSAVAKLAKLGLTEDEAKAIVGI